LRTAEAGEAGEREGRKRKKPAFTSWLVI